MNRPEKNCNEMNRHVVPRVFTGTDQLFKVTKVENSQRDVTRCKTKQNIKRTRFGILRNS
jgi:hypothetical protein